MTSPGGPLLLVNLTTANISDSAGAQTILDAIRKRLPSIKCLFADGAYERRQLLDKAEFLGFTVEIVRRIDEGFKIHHQSTENRGCPTGPICTIGIVRTAA